MKTTPLPVRLSDEQRKNLGDISRACRVKEVDALRWAVDALIGYWKAHKGRVLLPLNFEEDFLIVSGRPESGVLEEPPKRRAVARSKKGL